MGNAWMEKFVNFRHLFVCVCWQSAISLNYLCSICLQVPVYKPMLYQNNAVRSPLKWLFTFLCEGSRLTTFKKPSLIFYIPIVIIFSLLFTTETPTMSEHILNGIGRLILSPSNNIFVAQWYITKTHTQWARFSTYWISILTHFFKIINSFYIFSTTFQNNCML